MSAEGVAIREAIERSSLGNAEAAALRASVSDEQAARIVVMSKGLGAEANADCWCGADGGEGCWCCTDDCPEDCTADHKGEQ